MLRIKELNGFNSHLLSRKRIEKITVCTNILSSLYGKKCRCPWGICHTITNYHLIDRKQLDVGTDARTILISVMFALIIMFATSFFLLSLPFFSHCGEQTWYFQSNLQEDVYFRNSYWDYLQKSCCKITEFIGIQQQMETLFPKQKATSLTQNWFSTLPRGKQSHCFS